MFHILAFSEAAIAAAAVDDDINGVVDDEFSRRNNHFIFSEDYNLLAGVALGTSLVRARLNMPSINQIGRHQIWPVERSGTVPDLPGIQDFRDLPMPLPQSEEMAFETTNDLAMGTEIHNGIFWIAPKSWTKNLPQGGQHLTVRATGATTGVAQLWSGVGALTFAENLRGGWYSIIGCQAFDAGTLAYRFVFSKPFMVGGRKLRPGGLCVEAIGNTPHPMFDMGLGVWGRFHSFEPPQLQTLCNAAGATTTELRIHLVYHGDNTPR